MQTHSLRTVTSLRQTVSQTTGAPCGPVARKGAPGLRLTRRGRVVAAAAAALLVGAVMTAAATAAQAAGGGSARGSGHRVAGLVQVTVRPGDSLWSVAVRTAPDADARIITQEIIQLNHLPGLVLYPGEQLLVPGN